MTTLKQLNTPQQHALGAAVVAWAGQLATLSEDNNGLTCTYMTATHRATAVQIAQWMREAGMHAHIDAVGNVVGRFLSTDPQARTLITGSHYDTVRNGGKYDGRQGILTAIAVVKHLNDKGISLPFHLEVIAFADKEGTRFGGACLGSSAVIGQFDPAWLDARDRDGIALRDVLADAGQDLSTIAAIARDPSDLLGYVEFKLDHGAVLRDSGVPLGIVTSIAGSRRFLVQFDGVASHAATAAAEVLLYVEQRCAADAPASLAGTVGQLQLLDGAVGTVPGACRFSIDVRAASDTVRNAAVADIVAKIETVCLSRNIEFTVTPAADAGSVPCAPWLLGQLAAALQRAGATPFDLAAGGHHDAVLMARITDVAMLFTRCGNGGISHNPLEDLSVEDADVAARVLLDFLRHFKPKPSRLARKASPETATTQEYTQ